MIRSALWVIEQKILAEAEKPKGVTFHELRDRRDLPLSTSRDHCRRMVREGKLYCVRVKQSSGRRWFASKRDARAFSKGQSVPTPKPALRPTQPPATFDSRYCVDPQTFEGGELMAEWRRLRGTV